MPELKKQIEELMYDAAEQARRGRSEQAVKLVRQAYTRVKNVHGVVKTETDWRDAARAYKLLYQNVLVYLNSSGAATLGEEMPPEFIC